VATLSYNGLAEGDHVITASYSGDGNFVSSNTTSGVVQHVNQSSTTTTLSVAPNDVFGQNIAFTATVVASGGGGGTPQGEVIFLDQNSNLLGVAQLQNGQAVLHDSSLAIGSYAIRAVYVTTNNLNYLTSSSVPSPVTVAQAATSVALTSSANSSTFNQSTTYTATVSVTSPGSTFVAPPTGTVSFYDNGTLLDTETLTNSGVVSFSTSSLAVSQQNSHPITAVYNGDGNFLGATSSTLNQTVNTATPSVLVGSTHQNDAVFGQSVTLSAIVLSDAGIPTGTVTFFNGNTAISDPVALVNGSASINTSSLPTGSDTITAAYSGDSNFANVTSANFTQTINHSASATALSGSVNPGVSGQTVIFTATVTAAGLGAGIPTGTVSFFDGSTQIGLTQTLSSGTASVSTSALSTTGHTITAVYSGDGNFLTSTSPNLSQGENPDASSVSLNTAGSTNVYGVNPTLTATVSANSPGTGTPSGSITFYDGSGINAVSLGQATLTGGVATLSN
jgi:hypothetical protein